MTESSLSRSIDAAARDLDAQVVAWRRDLHANPELGNRETRTAGIVAAHLRSLGFDEVRTGVAHTGVVGLLKGGRPGKVVALRADMDALPVVERTDVPFASKARGTYNGESVGVMHACGHDCHVAVAMGVASVFAALREQVPGSIKFIFQPAEEMPPEGEEGGARLMIAEGALENPEPDAIFGLHVTSQLGTGTIGFKPGPTMASSDTFRIAVLGRQTHGAMPWRGVDPIVAAAQVVLGLQTIVSRQVDLTQEPAVVTVGSIRGGVRANIIPDRVDLVGTIRTFDEGMRDDIHARVTRTAESIAAASDAGCEVCVGKNYAVTINDAELTERMRPTLERVAGPGKAIVIPKVTGSEDFSFFQQKVPGLFFFVGVTPEGRDPKQSPPNHSPLFYVDEAALPLALRALAHVAADFLLALNTPRRATGSPMTYLQRLRDDWVAVERLLDEALDLPAEDRPAWLAALPAEAAMHRAVLAPLLAGDAAALPDAPSLSADAFGDAGDEADEADRGPGVGDAIGPYRLLEPIGRGGMGAVWLAEREDQSPRRKVALKLPHLTWRPGLARRLARERDILASIEHAHVARLYDAGVDALGRPWLAMEYVAGTPIDRHAAAHALSVDRRLELFAQVCRAVAHAHARLVVHGDLKPANILVTEDGDVRLLDFGVARLLAEDGGAAEDGAATREAGVGFTPGYASPEQARGEAIGTASDVWSLGVVLYELLAGTRPYALRGRSASALAGELARLAEAGFVPPSRAVVDPALRRQLAGDLDAIVCKALRADPAARYPTVESLLLDLDRHRRSLPVSARPDTRGYRLRRFLARHRWPTAFAALALLALVGGLTVSLWQADAARREAARADEVKAFVLSLLESADMDSGADGRTTARELLLAARDRVATQLADRPAIAAELMGAIGFGLIGHDAPVEAAALLRRAEALATASWGEDDPRTWTIRSNLGEALVYSGQPRQALALLEPATAWFTARDDRHGEANAWQWQASARIKLQEHDAAIAAAQRQVDAATRPAGPATIAARPRDVYEAWAMLANTLAQASRPGVVDASRKALDAARLLPGGVDRAVGVRTTLGRGLVAEGQVEAGLAELEAAYAALRSRLGPNHINARVAANRLGFDRLEAGDVDGALVALQAAYDAVFDPATVAPANERGIAALMLAQAFAAHDEPARALPLYAKAATQHAEVSAASPLGFRSRSGHALMLARLGRLDEAERAFAALRDAPAPPFERAADTGRLAELRLRQHRLDEAIALSRRAAEALAGHPSRTSRALSRQRLGDALLAAGRHEEAAAELGRAVELYAQAQRYASPDRVRAEAAWAAARGAASAATTASMAPSPAGRSGAR